ncbi:MAG: MFS transporter [Clostridia bacterium]|nr:MFS transporter [Clostridia bacterium]
MNGNGKKKKNVRVFFEAEQNSAAGLGRERLGRYTEIAIRMRHTRVLTTREMMFPALGEMAAKMVSAFDSYKIMYYTNVLHINYNYVLIIDMLIALYNVLNDPLMGVLYDKTRTRWGKSRPYIVFGSVPYFASTAVLYSGAVFLGGSSPNDPKKIMFLFLVLFVQETFSTIYSIPRNYMTSLMTPNSDDRINVGLLNKYLGDPGAKVVQLIIPIVMDLNNKKILHVSMPHLFMAVSILASTVGAAGNIAMAAGCQERILLQAKPAPLKKTMFYAFKNKYYMRNFLADFATNWWGNGGFSWDLVTHFSIFGGIIPNTWVAEGPKNILQTVSVTFIPKFRKLFKNNNRNGVIALRIWDMITFVLECVLIIPIIGRKNHWKVVGIFAVLYGINAMNDGPAEVFERELDREIADYTEYMTGERPDGTFGLLTQLIRNVTRPLGTMFNMAVMKWSGYDTSLDTEGYWVQGSRRVYQKVFFLYRGIDILPKAIRIIPYFFYDLVGEKYEQMYIALNERRAMIAQQDKTEIDEMLDAEEGEY